MINRLLRLIGINVESVPFSSSFPMMIPFREAVLCLDCDYVFRKALRRVLEETNLTNCPHCGGQSYHPLSAWLNRRDFAYNLVK